MDVAARLLLAYIPLGPYLIQLSIVPATTHEAAHMVDAALLVHSRCQGFDTQVKSGDRTFDTFFFPLTITE